MVAKHRRLRWESTDLLRDEPGPCLTLQGAGSNDGTILSPEKKPPGVGIEPL